MKKILNFFQKVFGFKTVVLNEKNVETTKVVKDIKPEKTPVDLYLDKIYEKICTNGEETQTEIQSDFAALPVEMREEVKRSAFARYEGYFRMSSSSDPRMWRFSDIADRYMTLYRWLEKL